MNWDAIGAIAESASAIMVLITLLYLAIQVKSLKVQSRIASSQHADTASNNISMGILGSPEIADLIVKALSSYSELTKSERLRYRQWLRIQTSQLSSIVAHIQLNRGTTDIADYAIDALPGLIALPGYRDYWKRDRHLYQPIFRDYVDAQLESMADE